MCDSPSFFSTLSPNSFSFLPFGHYRECFLCLLFRSSSYCILAAWKIWSYHHIYANDFQIHIALTYMCAKKMCLLDVVIGYLHRKSVSWNMGLMSFLQKQSSSDDPYLENSFSIHPVLKDRKLVSSSIFSFYYSLCHIPINKSLSGIIFVLFPSKLSLKPVNGCRGILFGKGPQDAMTEWRRKHEMEEKLISDILFQRLLLWEDGAQSLWGTSETPSTKCLSSMKEEGAGYLPIRLL